MSFEIESNEKFQSYVVNKLVPFPTMLEAAGYEDYSYEGKCFCPFHENYESPAAKIYQDRRGDTLFCFSEQKRYYPSDVLKKNLCRGKTLSSIFMALWRQLSDERKKAFINDFGAPVSYVPEGWDMNKEHLDKFRKGEVTFEEHLRMLLQLME